MQPSSRDAADETDWDANVPMEPRYFASGWTKIYIEKMCEFLRRLGVTRHTVIRHSNVFGPHDKFDLERSHVFGATVTKVMTAADGKMVVWGRGEEARDLLYVGDLVDFVTRASRPPNATLRALQCRIRTRDPHQRTRRRDRRCLGPQPQHRA